MPGTRPGNIDRLQDRVREGISKIRGLEIGDELAVEILAQLVDGRKTVSEIVEQIYGLKSTDGGFYSSYSRVRRGIRRLESKGLVSRALLGRDRPYRLTDLAVINLGRIGGGGRQVSVFTVTDLSIFAVTIGLCLPLVFLVLSWVEFSEPVIVAFFGCFCFLLGLSAGRFVQVLRKVF